MCRSIVRLRDGAVVGAPAEIEAAARQYVRKVSGFREPSGVNHEAFESAVRSIAAATNRLMAELVIRPRRTG